SSIVPRRPLCPTTSPRLALPCCSPSLPRPPSPTPFPYTTLFRSVQPLHRRLQGAGRCIPGDAGFGADRPHHHGRRQLNADRRARSEEHTSELQSRENLVCRRLPEKKKQPDLKGESHAAKEAKKAL